jgi:hypothetical protein
VVGFGLLMCTVITVLTKAHVADELAIADITCSLRVMSRFEQSLARDLAGFQNFDGKLLKN